MQPDGSVLFKKEMGLEALLASIRVNPRDWRQLCLCGQKGTLVELRLAAASRDRAEQQTYKVTPVPHAGPQPLLMGMSSRPTR